MLASEDFVASLHNQLVAFIVETPAGVVGDRGSSFQRRVRRNHLTRNQVLADAEVLE
jgi:hypothetical protein